MMQLLIYVLNLNYTFYNRRTTIANYRIEKLSKPDYEKCHTQ